MAYEKYVAPSKRATDTIVKVVGIVVIIAILISGVGYLISNWVPYTLTPISGLNNPNPYIVDYVYDECGYYYAYYDYDNTITRKLYELAGIQTYILYLYEDVNVQSYSEAKSFVQSWIDENINDPYGLYVVQTVTDPATQKSVNDYGYCLYGECFYGSAVQSILTSDVTNIFSAITNNGNIPWEYTSGGRYAYAMYITMDRCIHPYKAIASLLIKIVAIILIVVAIVIIIRKVDKRGRMKYVLNSSMEDLTEEYIDNRTNSPFK